MNPLLNPPNGTIVKIVSFLLSQRTAMGIRMRKYSTDSAAWAFRYSVQTSRALW